MEKKPIQAKNVVSFGDGKTINRPKPAAPAVEPVAEPVEASETVVKKAEAGFIKAEAVEEAVAEAAEAVETEVANEVSEEVPLREVPEPEAIETKPLNLRQDRYLDDDTTGAIVRKGLVIVSLIVILCCIVAIVMKQTGFSGVIMPDISALTDQAAAAASIALSNL